MSAGTDGRDVATNAAGGIGVNDTIIKIKKREVHLNSELENNNSHYILKAVESLLIMDGTSTNVADIQLIAIMG